MWHKKKAIAMYNEEWLKIYYGKEKCSYHM